MNISHETHIDMLQESKEFNDYEYSLLHLIHIPEYREFYKNTKREHYLDNSAYEYNIIDEDFNIDYFHKVVEDIKPTHVIVPDILSDKDATIQAFKDFDIFRLPEDTKLIGVIQGKTFEELHICFDYMVNRCDVVAIPFHSDAYQERFHNNLKDEADVIGRVKFIREVIEKGIKHNSLHLIGQALPIEMEMYSKSELEYIKSIDTASPVQWGMLETFYPKDIVEVKCKPSYVMTEENILSIPTQTQYSIIKSNINKFKIMTKGTNEVR